MSDLQSYVRPSVAVDTVVLTVAPDAGLSVLLVRGPGGGWALPGTFLHEGETLAQAVLRSLRDKAHVDGLRPRQLHVFDALDRDDRGWVLSVAHLDVVPWERLTPVPDDVRLVPPDRTGPLPFDHAEIVDLGVQHTRREYAAAPDPAGLLPQPFTLRQLQTLHEAVAGGALPRDTFRRRVEPALRDTGELSSGQVGKPARLFVRRGR
ncbi:NUDIX hydrolase [Kineococcus rhizosphaerae]|uniref:ADP-ribose pyrophosphatase YjhB (NUDIX family) n=1 Tax=Kineococcus rhizosphaerae TaxID=559628 RepID=A0A2T0QX11_9ACTN|nr:NUDIX domain-containing protein [Kineococcus rhizosphaerae]PRY10243.1 ADP-ribose pyrophosphatase YjhB (NUDIX family) [Kineococcus rhizosphaerae]